MIAKNDHHNALSYPYYTLSGDCTFEETYVIVAWLLRNRFKTFTTRIVSGSLTRNLESNRWFRTEKSGCCEYFNLVDDPVFLLKRIVLSPYATGPVLEVCCLGGSTGGERGEQKQSS